MPKLIRLDKMPSRSRRPTKGDLPPWEPGRSALRILGILREYRYLTTDLVALAYEAAHDRGKYQVRQQLTKLWRYGYVERHYRPAEWGSSQYVYTLSVDGARLVIDRKDWPYERHGVYNLAKVKRDYEHQLAVALVHMLWNLGSVSQDKLFLTAEAWHDKQGTPDRVVNEFAADVDGQDVKVQPDLTFLIGHQRKSYYRPYFFEIERTHKNWERIRRRFRAYGYLLGSKGEKAVAEIFERELGIVPERGMGVFIGADKAHAERLRFMARREVKPDTELWFGSLSDLFETKPSLRADGKPHLDRHGNPKEVEVPIPSEAFFERELLRNLDGKPGRLVV
jgi:hypothetical protein